MKRVALFAVVSVGFALAGCEGINAHYVPAKDGCCGKCAMPASSEATCKMPGMTMATAPATAPAVAK